MFEDSLKGLVDHLKENGVIKSKSVEDAFLAVDRKNFIPEKLQRLAYKDSPVVIAEEKTISQPTTVAFMLELLAVQEGNKILDIGAGSGWVACLMAYLSGEKGRVYGYEISELMGMIGMENVEKSGLKNVQYEIVDAKNKWEETAPYDRIYSGAAFSVIPMELKESLNIGGIMVVPTQDGNVMKITRINETEYEEEAHYGFTFVPFVD